MALCSGNLNAFFSTKAVSLSKPLGSTSSITTLRLLVPHSPSLANMRVVRTVTCATTASSSSKPRGIMKPQPVSPEMADVVGSSRISRAEGLKLIWAHIKDNNLQDPNNKKIIICDEKLKKIFNGRDQVGFLEIAGLISPHFLKESK